MRVENEQWYVIGTPETSTFMHWKGDGISGCFTETAEIKDAERYSTKGAALKAMRTDEDVKRWLEKVGGEPRPVRVTERIYAV